MKLSEIRGRGGAGFLTATKWGFIPKNSDKNHYLVVNADEGEPGTCKDRLILTNEPHKLLEGIVLSAFTVKAHTSYIYVRGEFSYEARRLQQAIDEAYQAKLIGKNNVFGWDIDIYIQPGAGAYVCGEETGLLNSLEGKPGRPRSKPPFPASAGLWKSPTIVNNVETISSIPEICKRGGKWFSSIGTPGSRGTKLYGISGHVNHPCLVEETMGVSLKELIDNHCGGIRGGWDNLLCVIPGGLSTQILTREEAEVAVMGYDELGKLGSGLGTAAVIVMDKSTNLFEAFNRLSSFYEHESCGQCGPCRIGTSELARLIKKFAEKKATRGDIDKLAEVAEVTTNCICYLATASSDPIKALLAKLKDKLIEQVN